MWRDEGRAADIVLDRVLVFELFLIVTLVPTKGKL